MSLIGFVGFASSGKGTAGQLLVKMGYDEDSFAAPLKDSLAAMFCWPRHMIEGDTQESRKFRETVDQWWAERLGIPDFSPRKAMQFIGTDVFRKYFNDGLWIMSLERRFLDRENKNVVVTDCRYPNEIKLLKKIGAKIIRIKKGDEPEWYNTALHENTEYPHGLMEEKYPEIHSSEWAWIGSPDIDLTIENDGTVDELHNKIKNILGA